MEYKIKRFSQIPPGKVILPGNKRPCDPLPRKFTDKPEYVGLEKFVRVEEAKKFTENIGKLPDISRKRVKNLRSSLKGNHIYDNGDYPDEETHYISKYSKDGKYHRLAKDINGHDRLDYIVYPPTLVENEETGERFLVSKVVLQNCVGHFDWKEEKFYSEED